MNLLAAREPFARAYATRVLGRWANQVPNVLTLLERLVGDVDPRVRMEAVVALSHLPVPESIGIAMRALDQPVDAPLQYSLTQAVHALAPIWLPALRRGDLSFQKVEHAAFVFATYDVTELAPTISRLIESQALSQSATEALLLQMARAGSVDDIGFVLQHAKDHPVAFEEIVKRAPKELLRFPANQEQIMKLLVSSRPSVRAHAIRLAGVADMKQQLAAFVQTAVDPSKLHGLRIAAIEAIGKMGDRQDLSVLRKLSQDSDRTIQVAAAIAIMRGDLMSGAHEIAPLLRTASTQDEVASLLEPAFNQIQGSARLAEVLIQTPLRADTAKWVARELHERGRSDERLQEVVAQSLGTDHGKREYSREYVSQLVKDAEEHGDADRGQRVFNSEFASCSACHRLNGQGATIGPDLTHLRRGLSPELIVESILWPSRQIKEGYVATQVVTDDGQVHRGYVVKNSRADTLVLKDPRSGAISRIPITEIDDRSESLTLMPEGLTRLMTTDELRDVVALLFRSDVVPSDAQP